LEGALVRKATAEDRKEVLSFCVGTFDWGDYIDEVYDFWLGAPDSLFLVAETAGKPVGIVHARQMRHGVAWLEGLRVSPAHRREGVGTALTAKAMEMLSEGGIKTLRLLVESNNEASMALAFGLGFREEATWAFYHGRKPREMPSHGPHWVTPASASNVWSRLDSSDLFNQACRSYENDWAIYPLESDDFSELVKGRMVATMGEGKEAALAVVHYGRTEGRDAKACFLLGDRPAVKELAAFVISKAARSGARRLHVSCPNHAGTTEGLKASGFRPGFRTSLVYRRNL